MTTTRSKLPPTWSDSAWIYIHIHIQSYLCFTNFYKENESKPFSKLQGYKTYNSNKPRFKFRENLDTVSYTSCVVFQQELEFHLDNPHNPVTQTFIMCTTEMKPQFDDNGVV